MLDRARSSVKKGPVGVPRGEVGFDGSKQPRRRRSRQEERRRRQVKLLFSEEEYAAFAAAAARQGLAYGAYGAQVCMAHVRGLDSVEHEVMRELLKSLMLTAGHVRKVAVLLNQVARLRPTGHQPEQLVLYAAAADRTLRMVDEVAARVRARLR